MFLKSSHLDAPTFDTETVARIHADWSECIGRDVDDYERAYADHLANLRALIALQDGPPKPSLLKRVFGGQGSPAKDPQTLYRFAICFSSDAFFKGVGGRGATQQQLNLIHADHLELIDRLLEQPDRVLTDTPLPRDKGMLGDTIEAALLIYFYQTDYGPQGARLTEEASLRVPRLLRYAPYLNSNITASLLSHHPNLAQETSALICEVYGGTASSTEDNIWSSVTLNMVGPYARRENKFRQAGPEIMGMVLKSAKHWTHAQLAAFTEDFALRPLALNLGTQDEEAARARSEIARSEKQLGQGFDDSSSPLSPKQQEELCRKRLAKAKARLEQITSDFPSLRRDHVVSAGKHLAIASDPRRTVEAMVKALPDDLTAPLKDVLEQAKVIKARPKRFTMPKPSENRFKDFGFKIMVIEELMYVQKRLEPIFDLRLFADEWTKREISVEDDGYDIIPEVRTYFKSLPIPDEALAHVEVLIQRSGLDGSGGQTMDQLYPFWDPGAGDVPIPITNKAIEDLELLPNLKCVVGLEHETNTPRPTKLVKALKDRGIELIDEDLAIWGKP